jgi:hypothetical protein
MAISKGDLELLKELRNANKPIPLNSINSSLKNNFDTFFFGKTLLKENNQLYAFPSDIQRWAAYELEKDN